MPQRRPQVTQADIARAIRAMQAAGYEVEVVLTRDGAVVRPVRIEKPSDYRYPACDEPERIIDLW
jgi:hypothetical protein